MTWQLFLIISIIGEVTGRLMQRTLLKNDKSDPAAYAIVFQIMAGIFVGIYAIFNGFSFPPVEKVWQNLLLMPILFGTANVLIFRSLKTTEASIFTVLFSTRALWIVIGALLLFKESFSPTQIIGALLLFASVVLVSWRKEQLRFQKGEMTALLAAVVFALAILNDSFIVKYSDVPSYTAISFILTGLCIWIVYPFKTPLVKDLVVGKNNWKFAILSAFYVMGATAYLLAYQVGNNAAQIGALFQISTIATVILAIFLLNEKSSLLLKIAATLISVVGVILVS